jgi:hypothetical protein
MAVVPGGLALRALDRAERCCVLRASGSSQRAVSVRRILPSNPRKRGDGEEPAGGPRERDVRGPANPRFFMNARESKGSCDGIVTSLAVARLRPTKAHDERHRSPAGGAAVS